MSTSLSNGRVHADPPLLPAPASPVMSLGWVREGTVTVVEVRGEVDMSNAHLLIDLAARLGGEHARRVVLDLSRVRFIDLHGLTALLEAGHRIRSGGGTLTLRRPSRCVTRLLRLTGTTALASRWAEPDGSGPDGSDASGDAAGERGGGPTTGSPLAARAVP